MGLFVGLVVARSHAHDERLALRDPYPLDAVAFATAPVVLLLVALSACVLPAVRVTSIAPTQALRQE